MQHENVLRVCNIDSHAGYLRITLYFSHVPYVYTILLVAVPYLKDTNVSAELYQLKDYKKI